MRWTMTLSALALAGCVATPQQQASRQAENDRDFARFIGDRVAGTPQDCIPMGSGTSGPTIIDNRRVIYQTNGRMYLSELPAACTSLEPLSTIIVEVNGGQLCRNDRFRAVQPGTSIPGGYCVFGRFTPYTRP